MPKSEYGMIVDGASKRSIDVETNREETNGIKHLSEYV